MNVSRRQLRKLVKQAMVYGCQLGVLGSDAVDPVSMARRAAAEAMRWDIGGTFNLELEIFERDVLKAWAAWERMPE